jgi:hypothetical protein
MTSQALRWLWLSMLLASLSACGWELCAPGYVPGRYGCIISCRDFPEGGPIRCFTVRDGVAFDTGVDAVPQDVREEPRDVRDDHVDASMDVTDVNTGDTRDASDASDASDVRDAGAVIDPTLAAPRAIAPLSTSTVTSQRPTLRWQNGPSHDGAVVELSRTRDFARVERSERATGDRVRPASVLSAGVWFWRVRARDSARNAEGSATSPAWWFRVGARSADGDRDTSWGTELDVNGDGYADVAVGSPNAEMGRGRVDVFYGGPSGIGSTPSLTLRGAAMGDLFGRSVASAGDVNGDGFADLIVGADGADPGGRMGAGTASVYLGGSGWLSMTPHRVLEGAAGGDWFGVSVATARERAARLPSGRRMRVATTAG